MPVSMMYASTPAAVVVLRVAVGEAERRLVDAIEAPRRRRLHDARLELLILLDVRHARVVAQHAQGGRAHVVRREAMHRAAEAVARHEAAPVRELVRDAIHVGLAVLIDDDVRAGDRLAGGTRVARSARGRRRPARSGWRGTSSNPSRTARGPDVAISIRSVKRFSIIGLLRHERWMGIVGGQGAPQGQPSEAPCGKSTKSKAPAWRGRGIVRWG
jgi:hypothetical protein